MAMSTGVATALLEGLVDDAGLFPPSSLPLPDALGGYRATTGGPYATLVGRFLCPASRVDELIGLLEADDRIPLGLILDTGIPGVAEAVAQTVEERRLELTAVEFPLPPDADQAAAARESLHTLHRLPPDTRAYIELPRVHGWRDALSLIAARGGGAKLRTGGLVADAFPTEREVADFIRACVEEDVAFKFTAGLHKALRHRDEHTGFEHHGFLNILVATALAVRGARVPHLVRALGERDPAELVDQCLAVDDATAALIRRHFVSYGSCSFTEPVDDLTGLGLLEKKGPKGT
jgi:hypothetical protein